MAEAEVPNDHAPVRRPRGTLAAPSERHELVDAARVEAVGRIAAGLAHQVKNPLGVLALGLALIRRHPLAEDGELAEVLRDMAEAVARANAAVVDLLELAAARVPRPARCELDAPLSRALALVRLQKCCVGRELVEERSVGLPPALIDEASATHALVNVLLDVAETSGPGGAIRVRSFTVGAGEPAASSTGGSEHGWVACEVEARSASAAPFADGAAAVAGSRGLALSRALLDEQGGWLRVARGHGGGARVTIAYPAAE